MIADLPAAPPPAQPECAHCWHSNGTDKAFYDGNAPGSYCCRCTETSIGVFGPRFPWVPPRPDEDHSRKYDGMARIAESLRRA